MSAPTTATVQLRPARPEDAAACVQLRGMTRENAVSVQRLAALGITTDSWAADVRSGQLLGWVAHQGPAQAADPGSACGPARALNGLAGYCFGDRLTGEVVVLALLPAFEQQGLGKALLATVMQALQQSGHQRLFLGCSADPASRSHGFYRHLGWRPTGEIDKLGDEVLVYSLPG